MQQLRDRSLWLETIGFAVAAVLLYQSALLLMLSVVPLVMLLRRRGELWYLIGSGLAVAAIGLFRLVQLSRVQVSGVGGLVLIDIAVPAVLIAGLFVIGSPRFRGYRGVCKFGVCSAVFGLLSLFVVVPAATSGSVQALMEDQFRLFVQMVSRGEGGAEGGIEQVAAIATESLLASYVMIYAFMLGLNWYVGSNLAAKFYSGVEPLRLRDFRLPAWFIWLLIGAGALTLLDIAVGLGALRYFAWNVGLFALLLFGVQGLGLLWYLFDRNQLGQGGRIMAGLTLIVLLFVPGFNLLVLLGLPGFGISEIWVRYRRTKQ